MSNCEKQRRTALISVENTRPARWNKAKFIMIEYKYEYIKLKTEDR